MLGEHNAWRRGNSHTCARCGTCAESLAHAYAECKDVRGLWDLVLDRWEVATSERLDPRDRRVTLLGDRGETDLATSREMWRLVHAATAWVIHKTISAARDARDGGQAWARPPHAMLREVQRELQRLVTAAWITRSADTSIPWGDWHKEKWVHGCGSCGGRVSAQVLLRGHSRLDSWPVSAAV